MMAVLWGPRLSAQDFVYSQYYHSPLRMSPGLTGIFAGDLRVAALYRNQWTSVPVDYNTFSVTADQRFIGDYTRTGFWAAGLGINYDQAGDSRLGWADVNLNVSYSKVITPNTFLTIGGQAALVQRRIDLPDLRFDEQYDDGRGTYNPNLPHGETFARTSNWFGDMGAGINLRIQAERHDAVVDRLDKRSKLDIGIGVFHLNKPNQSFLDDSEVLLPVRISPYFMGVLQLGQSLDLTASYTYQRQTVYEQWAGALGLRAYFNRDLGRQISVELGAGYRFDLGGDAWYPHIEVQYNRWYAGLSYDINVSDFNVATNGRGGPELFVRYILAKIHPRRACLLI